MATATPVVIGQFPARQIVCVLRIAHGSSLFHALTITDTTSGSKTIPIDIYQVDKLWNGTGFAGASKSQGSSSIVSYRIVDCQ
jgi:hypothetical protein